MGIRAGWVLCVVLAATSPAAADEGAAVVTPSAYTCNTATLPAVSAYFAESHPAATGLSGQRAFATDTRAAIFWNQAQSFSIVAPLTTIM